MHKLKEIQRYTKSKIKMIKPPSFEDIKENKLNSVIDEVREVLVENKFGKYTQYIENLVEEINEKEEDLTITSEDVAAAFLKIAMKKLVMGSSADANLEMPARSNYEQRESRGSYNDVGYSRLFINIGKKDKLKESNLVKLIASETSLSGKQIGKIDMLEKFSFFEIPGEFVDEVLEILPQQKVRGRQINVEVANKKKRR